MQSKKEDLRVRKTKKALFDAFMSLLAKKPYEDITINELCDAADVRRATFYKHYSDKVSFVTASLYAADSVTGVPTYTSPTGLIFADTATLLLSRLMLLLALL